MKAIRRSPQTPADGQRSTRRAFMAGMVGARLLPAFDRHKDRNGRPADVTLQIERAKIEVAPGRVITTSTYNGTVSGPPLRLTEGVANSVTIWNRTDVPEYVHWHGFEVPPELDGTE